MAKKILQNVTDTPDTTKKRKNVSIEEDGAVKKRRVEVDDDNDICIIDNDDMLHDNSSKIKNLTPRKRKFSEDTDCLIVCDDMHSD